MNRDVLESLADRIPFEVRATLRGLDDDTRLGLVVALLDDGEMTFNEIKNKFQMNSSSLSNHLSILQEGNLVRNFYKKNNGRVSSYYDVTDIAESMLHAILDVAFNNSNTTHVKSDKELLKNTTTLTRDADYYKDV